MRKQIIVCLLIFCLMSCETTMELNTSKKDQPVALAALIVGGDSTHDIYAGLCTGTDVSGLPAGIDATLKINDKDYPINVLRSVSGPDTLRFVYDFKPGEKVSIGLAGAGYNLFAETEIPSPCECVCIDTLTTYNLGTGERQTLLTATISRAGNVWFKTFDAELELQHYEGTTGEVMAEGVAPGAGILNMDTPFFNNKAVELPDDFAGELGLPASYLSNGWKLFFLDENEPDEFHLDWVIHYRGVYSRVKNPPLLHYDIWMTHITAKATIWSVERNTWMYLNSLNTIYSSSGDSFSEPAVLPCNVIGGTGYFGAVYKTDIRLTLPDMLLGKDIYITKG